jgi:hypothetical protein
MLGARPEIPNQVGVKSLSKIAGDFYMRAQFANDINMNHCLDLACAYAGSFFDADLIQRKAFVSISA